MNVLVIGYVWPEPASSAAGYRMLALLEAFRQQGWPVTFASPAEKSVHRADLPARGISEVNIRLNCSSFDDFIRELQPDLVMFDRFMMEEQFGWRVEKHCPDAIRQLPGFEQRAHFLTIGNFRHAPNWDAVLWLKESLWPRIREQLPRAELHIYGAYPPPKATALHNERQGFLIRGWAEDAAQVLKQARINLAPLRFGAGLKGKLADALACGTPSVTTSVGAEGMGDQGAWPLPVADEADAFAAAAVALYRDPQRWSRYQQDGIELYNRHFAFQPHADALIRHLQQLRRNLNQHRLNNFTGAMLRHHTLKSTQYMAQWIEAKTAKNEPDR